MPKNANEVPSQAYLQAVFEYVENTFEDDIFTGALIYRDKEVLTEIGMHIRTAGKNANRRAGYFTNTGYRRICIKGNTFPESLIIYQWHYGNADIDLDMDHKDRNKLNNSIDNLRQVSRSENLKNRDWSYNELPNSGYIWVRVTKFNNYQVQAVLEGKTNDFGTYSTLKEAVKVRDEAFKETRGIEKWRVMLEQEKALRAGTHTKDLSDKDLKTIVTQQQSKIIELQTKLEKQQEQMQTQINEQQKQINELEAKVNKLRPYARAYKKLKAKHSETKLH